MKAFQCILLLISGSVLLAQTADERAAIERAVLAASARMVQAAQETDVDGLFGFMLENDKGSIIQNGAMLLTRGQALERTRNNMRAISKVEYRWNQQHVTVLSPSIAVLVQEGESSATTAQGATFTTPFAQTLVMVLRGGEWKVLHAHQSTPVRR